jgi:hypothetical protein
MDTIANPQDLSRHRRPRRLQFGLGSMVLAITGIAACFGAIRFWESLKQGPLLSYRQANFVQFVSGSAYIAAIGGALCGLTVGAAIRTIRTRRAAGLVTGAVYGVVPGATIGMGAAAVIGTLQAILSSPGGKGGYLVPEWSFWLAPCLALLAAGLAARLVVPDAHAEPRQARKAFWIVVIWTVSCGLMAALAWAWLGFSGYFIRQTNEGPMRAALTGFLFGGGGALVCLVAGELLLRWEAGSFTKRPKLEPAATV